MERRPAPRGKLALVPTQHRPPATPLDIPAPDLDRLAVALCRCLAACWRKHEAAKDAKAA